jgi:predicted negative regulator of RcsB-dependent stress response
MNRFLVVLLLLVAGVVGLGFYLGWFRFSTDSEGQKTNITITVDQEKIREDEEKAKEKVQQVGQKVKERTGAGTEKSNKESPRP